MNTEDYREQTAKYIEGLLKHRMTKPYPDYNEGLLPDEPGYSEEQQFSNYYHQEKVEHTIEKVLSVIQEAERNARIEELDRTINIIWGTSEQPNHQLLKMTKSRLEELKKGVDK